jgi:hypothetical protein
MQIDNILVLSPPDYTHNQAFFEIALSFQSALKQIGDEPQLTTNPDECEGTTLVFGAHLIPALGGEIDGGNYIIYQSEQLTATNSLFVDGKYKDILGKHPVWDYSTENISALKKFGIDATHVPIGYSKCMSNIKTGRSATITGGGTAGKVAIGYAEWGGVYPQVSPDGQFTQDIDVCFYGSVNERRLKILDALKAVKVKEELTDGNVIERNLTVASFVGYGGYRDKLIARSKIVLNLHYYDSAIFETFRCSHLFANKKLVISEFGKDKGLEEKYYHGAVFCEYDDIVTSCIHYLKEGNEERGEIAKQGFDIFRSVTQADILRKVFG